jgi:hypothetical protein
MADGSRPINIVVSDYWNLPVPAELQAEAKALDARDLSPGDGQLRWEDSNGEPAFEETYDRLARAAAAKAYSDLDKRITSTRTDAPRRQEVATKARLFNELKKVLGGIGADAPAIRMIERNRDSTSPVYDATLTKALSDDVIVLTLVAADDGDSLATKVAIGARKVPQLERFLNERLADKDVARTRERFDTVIKHWGLNEATLAMPPRERVAGWDQTPTPSKWGTPQAKFIGGLTAEADGRLVVKSTGGLYPGTAEFRVESLGGAPVVTNNWTSQDGKQQRILMLTDDGWRLIRETTKP